MNEGIAMQHKLCRGVWTYSPSRTPSAIHRVRLQGITWLQILWTAILCVLVDYGIAHRYHAAAHLITTTDS